MTADYPTSIVGYGQDDFHNVNSLGSTTLSGAITGTPATFTVADATVVTTWPTANFTVRLDNELIFVSSRTSNTLTVGQRGHDGTTSADHSNGVTVSVVFTAGHIERLQEEVIAVETALGTDLTNVLTPTNTKTVTNKTFSDATTVIGDDGDVTKALKFQLSGATTAKTATIASSHTDNRTITLPNATDTLVGLATADALTNKTITADTNTVRATSIGANITDAVTITGVPTVGQVPKATGANTATWQDDATGGGAGAEAGASYLQLSYAAGNTAERVFVPGNGLTGTDAGTPGTDATYTVAVVAASGSNLVANADDLDWTGTTVRKNTGANIGTRPRLNFIEGTNITLGITEDTTDDEIDITITAAGGGGGGAPVDAAYLVSDYHADLTAENKLVAGGGLTSATSGTPGTTGEFTINVGAGVGITVAADSVAVDQSASFDPTWLGDHTFSGILVIPTATAPAQTTEGSVVWDSDDNKLTIGDGSARQTMVNETRTIASGDGLTGGGDLSANRTFAVGAGTGITVAADSVAVDQAFSPTWTGTHSFQDTTKFSVVDQTDATKKIQFNAGGTTGTTTTIATAQTVSRIVTLPDADDTLVGKATTDTFTNKTLSTGTVITTGPTMTLGSDGTGDIYYRNASGVLTRLAIGSTDQVLKVASGLPSWAAAPTTVPLERFLSPGSAILPNTNFPALVKTSGTNLVFYELDYDATTSEAAYWNFDALAATDLTITVYWKAAATTGNVVWEVTTRSVGDAGTWDSAGTTTDFTADAAKGTAEQVNEASLTLTTPYTAGQLVQFKLARDTGASDTMTGDARLLGIKLVWA